MNTTTKFCKLSARAPREYPVDDLRTSGTASRDVGNNGPWAGSVRVVVEADGQTVTMRLDTETAAEFALNLLESTLCARGGGWHTTSDDHPFEPLPEALEARLVECAAWARPVPRVAKAAPWPRLPPGVRAAALPANYADQLVNLADAPDHGFTGDWRRLDEVPVYADARAHLVSAGMIQLAPHLPGCGRCTPDGLAVAAEVRRLKG